MEHLLILPFKTCVREDGCLQACCLTDVDKWGEAKHLFEEQLRKAGGPTSLSWQGEKITVGRQGKPLLIRRLICPFSGKPKTATSRSKKVRVACLRSPGRLVFTILLL